MYIGYSKNTKEREYTHKKHLNNNIHDNIHLQRAWNEYGKESFLFEILVECEEKYLASEEHYWCLMLNTHDKRYGYNERPTDPTGKPGHSEETCERIRQGWRKRIISLGRIPYAPYIDKRPRMNKKELAIHMSNKLKERWKNPESALKMLQNRPSKRAPHSEERKRKTSLSMKGKNQPHLCTREVYDKRSQTCKKDIVQFSLTGEPIKEWKGIITAATALNIKTTGITMCLRGVRNTCGGYIWKYKTT